MHRVAFSYYGGKGKLANKYPKPLYPTIVEPFAGGACYSLKYYWKKILLIDSNPNVISIWHFIQSEDCLKWIDKIPKSISSGQKISNIDSIKSFPKGLYYLLQSAANVGCAGTKKAQNVDTITKIGSACWRNNTIDKIRYWHDKIKHWDILLGDYKEVKNIKATWFIDPPYCNNAGQRYTHNSIDYQSLTKWVEKRQGQVIVCENHGSNWLKFDRFQDNRTVANQSAGPEAIYYRCDRGLV